MSSVMPCNTLLRPNDLLTWLNFNKGSDEGIVFNERFFKESPNLVPELLPKFQHLEEVVRVIDVSAVANGQVMRILMNGELDEAVSTSANRTIQRVSALIGGAASEYVAAKPLGYLP